MEQITIDTTQNVGIEYTVAGIGDRVLATIVDGLILTGYTIFASMFSGVLASVVTSDFQWAIYTLVFFLPLVLYNLLMELLFNGQTVGKIVRHIRVVKVDGTQPSISSYLLRWLMRFVEIYSCFGSIAVLTMLINGKGQRLGDIAAGTTVIKLTEDVSLDDTILTSVKQDYIPVFPQADLLDDEKIALAKEVINAVVEDDRLQTKKRTMLLKTKEMLEKNMEITSDLTPQAFIQTVIKDYNFLKMKSF